MDRTFMTVLGRIIIYSRDVPKMAAFYARHFGFQVIRQPGDRIVELCPPDGGAATLLRPVSAGQRNGQAQVKLVFDREDVGAFCQQAAQQGLTLGPIHQAEGYQFANAKDPSGNTVQVSGRAFRCVP